MLDNGSKIEVTNDNCNLNTGIGSGRRRETTDGAWCVEEGVFGREAGQGGHVSHSQMAVVSVGDACLRTSRGKGGGHLGGPSRANCWLEHLFGCGIGVEWASSANRQADCRVGCFQKLGEVAL